MARTRPSVFVGSSVEGLKIAQAVQRRLEYAADVDLWDQATFDLSGVTIEALEERCHTADFAVFVLTPDDVTIKRKKKTAAVRDNVIFELGLFTGTLGRERCFLIHDGEQKIDLPSDLAGITPATFRLQQSGDLDASLGAACSKIEKRMEKLKERRKLSSEALSAIGDLAAFCDRVRGDWWQAVQPSDASALSFVHVEPDPAGNCVRMSGLAYDTDGAPIADWYTLSVSANPAERKLSYIWEGSHPRQPNDPYQGFGAFTFDDSPGQFKAGRGIFFNANLADLKTTRRKSVVFRRCIDKKELETMNGADGARVAGLIIEKLKSW